MAGTFACAPAHVHHQGCDCAAASRRRFLAGLGAAAAGAMLPRASFAQAARPDVIDTHHHFYAPPYLKAWNDWDDARKIPHFPVHAGWTPQKAVEGMDAAGIRTAMLSLPSTPGLWYDMSTPDAVALARICNDYAADMQRDYPGRFGLFATLSMLDADQTLKEIDYVFGTLKADGVGLQSSYGEKWLGHADFKPVFEELDRRKAVVYVHPVSGACCGSLPVGVFNSVIEVPFDTTRTVTNLLMSGTLARLRDIRWLFSHAGGTLPMMAGRINAFYANHPKRPEFAPDGIEAELQRLYYDTANATFPPNMVALLKFVPSSHVTYGTDYPYFRLDQVTNLQKLDLAPDDLAAIEHGTAASLVPRLKA